MRKICSWCEGGLVMNPADCSQCEGACVLDVEERPCTCTSTGDLHAADCGSPEQQEDGK